MANTEHENPLGYVDVKRHPRQQDAGRADNGGPAAAVSIGANQTGSVASLRALLSASSAHGVGYYTSARLDQMTKNDMVMAARLIQDAGSVK